MEIIKKITNKPRLTKPVKIGDNVTHWNLTRGNGHDLTMTLPAGTALFLKDQNTSKYHKFSARIENEESKKKVID